MLSELQKVKISGEYHKDFKITVDGKELTNIIDVDVKLGEPHEITVRMFADVEIDTEALVIKKMFAVVDGKKYKLQEVEE